MTTEQTTRIKALCHDCKKDYEAMPLDVVLPDNQWEIICPEGGVLCVSCIIERASKISGVVVARMVLEYVDHENQTTRIESQK